MESQASAELDSLYREAVELADRSRGWFDGPGLAWREALPPPLRAGAATEALAITARLMACMAWLLDRNHMLPNGRSPTLAFPPDADLSLAAALGVSPGADIAAASRRLVARIAALAGPAAPVEPATGDAADADESVSTEHQQDIDAIWQQ